MTFEINMILAALLMTLSATPALHLSPSTQLSREPAALRLGPQGEILAWLVAGPFPNVGALELKGTGFQRDYLNPEAAASPRERDPIAKIPQEAAEDPKLIIPRKEGWQLGIADPKSGLDLAKLLNGSKPGIAYCYAELESPGAQQAHLLFGSDDGAKIWLNGTKIFEKQLARGVKRDEDKVVLDLKQGNNKLLFKIEQGNGGWGLLARIVGVDGRPIEGLKSWLSLYGVGDVKSSVERWVRMGVANHGSIDVHEALSYEHWKTRATRWLKNFRPQAAHPVSLESALAVNVPSRGTSDEISLNLASARKSIERAYHTARKPFLERFQNPGPQIRPPIGDEDYAKPMPGGRYFVHADGTSFIPIGYNHNPDWTTFNQAHGDEDNFDPTQADKHMAHVKSKGVNLIRLMIETPPSGNLEEPLGVFRPEHVVWIDTIVAAARKHGVKLIITPWDTFWMNLRWETTAYNPDNGGLVKQRLDFITSPEVRKQQKRRLQYMIDRWGNTGTIFSWEILNEGDLWWGANAAQLEEWATDMAGYVRQYEKGKWGRNHMVSFSFAEAMPKGDMAKFAYTSKLFDYATTHLYIGASKAPVEAVGPAMAINQGVQYAVAQIRDNRPYMDTENGPIDKWIAGVKLDNEVFHAMSWAHIASGGAGSGLRWPYRNPHHLTEGMLDTLKVMQTFTKAVDWKRLAGTHVPIKVVGEKGAALCAFATAKSALIWTSGSDALELDYSGVKRVRLFNCRTGAWSEVKPAKLSSGRLRIATGIGSSAAIVLER